MGSITYPSVTGPTSHGAVTTVAVGDLVTGRDGIGRLVVGTVIATHPHYPSLTVDGIEVGPGGDIASARSTVHLDRVLTHERKPVRLGQSR